MNHISLYIHWPFCKSKCPYCDFNSHVAKEVDQELWLKAYLAELDLYKDFFKGRYIRSIFFGGGTPSLMPPKILSTIMDYIASVSIIEDETEVTLEANPTSSESQNFKAFAAAGVNRISIGVQSFDEDRLKFLGREHSAAEAQKAIDLAAGIFPRFSFDLIYATPFQTTKMWERELREAMSFAVDHISLYQLTIEKGTKFYSEYQKGSFKMPDSDLADDLYEMTEDILSSKNLKLYEISNYAKPGFESKHNLSYWQYKDYLGIGPGAHSRISSENNGKISMSAFYMLHNPTSWLNTNLEGKSATQHSEILNAEELLTEILMMGLRLVEGINYDNLQKFFGKNFEELIESQSLNMMVANDLIFYDEKNVKLTKKGFKLHQKIMENLKFI